MLVDIRWIVLVVLGGGAVALTALRPELVAPVTAGVAVIGLLYMLMRLGKSE